MPAAGRVRREAGESVLDGRPRRPVVDEHARFGDASPGGAGRAGGQRADEQGGLGTLTG
ncbi:MULTISPECIES: hypothetical protein [unclassified Frigoribacterium]|uniref:hypothetical protein n=1 Tax=unclassified Frigoribacterium TaxID=2627005 RepID=UPI000B319415|nr:MULTISPECIES: hypothetical protein [unclassified Frigoribacterium]